ncbi:MICAL-like protein 2 isoform X2 [Pogona vitticeps]
MAAIQALQQWCKQQCQGYKDVSITNMTTSFRDGLAFCAILHRHRPDLIDFSALCKENVYENNELAFRVAEEELGIPALLDAEDMVALKVPDRLSILTYVSQYYNYFHGRSPIGGMAGVKRPPSKPSEEPTGKKAVTEPATPPPPKPSPVYVPPGPKTNSAVQGKENALVAAKRHALTESTNTRHSNCTICGTHVHLVQRLLVDGKLYHRNCFRCKQCSGTLQSGNYKAGNEPGVFICNQHEQPSHLQNSLLVRTRDTLGENKPTDTTSASRSYLKALESKKPAEEAIKTIQVPKRSVVEKSTAGDPVNFGMIKSSPVTANPSSHKLDPLRTNPDHRETPAASSSSSTPSHWTASSAKTQEARTKFFQSGLRNSGSPADKAGGVKNQGAPFSSSQVAGGSPVPGSHDLETSVGSSEKNRARNILMQALPGSQVSTNRTGNSSTSSSASNVRLSHTPSSGFRHLETKNVPPNVISKPVSAPTTVEKTNRGSPGTPAAANKDLNQKGNIWTAAPNRFKDQPISQPAHSGHKLDEKITKAEGKRATDEKSESPADWRSRLKPVPSKVSNRDEAKTFQKPADVHKGPVTVSLNPTRDDKKPVSSVTSSAGHDAAPSSDQQRKRKLLVVQVETSGGWEKARQTWEDPPGTQKREAPTRPQEKAVASVKPSSPRTFRKRPSSQTLSPSKHRPDYIPEEEIQKEVQQIEKDLDKLELKGVDMEKDLRTCEGDDTEDALMVEWFKLIHEKQLLLRRESELMHKLNQQKLEEKQCDIESELRCLMGKSEFLKTPKEKAREEELLKLYVATVNDRNKIVEDLDEDRLREQEEDEMLAAMIQKLDVPRDSQESDRKKTKFPFFKMLKTKN